MAASVLTMRWTPVRQQPRWERALTHPPGGCPVLRATPCRPRQARSPRRAPCQEPGVIAGCREYELHAPPALSRAAPAARPAAGSAALGDADAQPAPRGNGFSSRCPMPPGSGALTQGFRGHCGSPHRTWPPCCGRGGPARPRPAAPGHGGPGRPRRRHLRGAVALSALTSALRSHGNGPSRWLGPCGRGRSSSRRDRAPWRRRLGDTRADRYPAAASRQVFFTSGA